MVGLLRYWARLAIVWPRRVTLRHAPRPREVQLLHGAPWCVNHLTGDEHRCEGPDGWRRRIPLHLDKSRSRTRPLAQPRCAMIAGEHIRIAMRAGRIVRLACRVVPGAAGEANHPWPQGIGNDDAGETGAPLVEHAHHLAIANAALARIGGVDREALAPGCLAARTDRPGIHLAVQFVLRLA